MQEVEDSKQKQGIICRIVSGETQFIHPIFAEYFAATALRDLIKAAHVQDFERIVRVVLLLLDIAESAVMNHRDENLVGVVQAIVPIDELRSQVTRGYWRPSALWKATERGQLGVIKVLAFVSGIFKDERYRELETLAKVMIVDCSGPYIFRGVLHLPIVSALQDHAPTPVIEALQDITDNLEDLESDARGSVVPSKLCDTILDINIWDNLEHCTPLHLAAREGFERIMRAFCENKSRHRVRLRRY